MNPLPSHLEADLLTLIEGGALAPDRAAMVAEALRDDPALAALARAMHADRVATASLPAVSAPSDLLARVEAVLEREALVGPAVTEPGGVLHLPVSRIQPRGASGWSRFRGSRWAAPLSMAALFAILAGATLLALRGTPRPRTVAMNSTRAPEEWQSKAAPLPEPASGSAGLLASGEKYGSPKSTGSGGGLADRSIDRGMNLAGQGQFSNRAGPSMEDTAADHGDDRPRAPGIAAADADMQARKDTAKSDPGVAKSLTLASTTEAGRGQDEKDASPVDAESKTLSLDRAVELARDGRLAVRLTAAVPERVEERLKSVANRFAWAGAPQTVSAPEAQELHELARARDFDKGEHLVRREIETPSRSMPGGLPAPAPTASGTGEAAPAAGAPPATVGATPAPVVPAAPDAPEPARMAFRLTAPADAARLAQLVTAMRGEPGWSSVELVELPARAEPAPAAGAPAILQPADPALFVWWTLSPRRWTPRASLPVLIEPITTTRER